LKNNCCYRDESESKTTQKAIIEINELDFAYEAELILVDVNLTVYEYDFLAIIGPNGGGKTTLLKLILGLEKPLNGSISVLGTRPEKARFQIGYVPQFGNYDREFPLLVKDVVRLSSVTNFSLTPFYLKKINQKTDEILTKLSVNHLAEKSFSSLSGGERQRVLIARALMNDPKILILDEPTASVDSSKEKDVYEQLKKLNNDLTIILVSHDIGFVSTFIKRIACINRSLLIHSSEEISRSDHHNLYNDRMRIVDHNCNL